MIAPILMLGKHVVLRNSMFLEELAFHRACWPQCCLGNVQQCGLYGASMIGVHAFHLHLGVIARRMAEDKSKIVVV